LPLESFTDCTDCVESLQPTTTTFRLPAVCAAVNGTAGEAVGTCGVA